MLTVADGAVAAGWDVVVSVECLPATRSLTEDLEARPHVRYRDRRISSNGGPRGLLRQAVPLARLLAQERPSAAMIVLPWPTRGLGQIVGTALAGIPTAVVFQLAPWSTPLGPQRILYRWANRRRQQWISVSTQNGNALADTFGLPKSSIMTVHNGVPHRDPPQASEVAAARTALRTELGLPHDARIVLTVGRLHDQKGHKDLLEILPAALEGRPDTYFVWAGDGELQPELAAAIRTLDLQQHVRMLGRREDVQRLLWGSDLFLLPSRFEGHPFALLEAMGQGVPAVSSDAGGAPEVIRNGVDGLIHERGQPEDLARQLIWALEHPDEMREMAASARARVNAFSESRMLEETLSVLENLATR
jgi:glycosyltransferase involved in cell wall biosynthesis